MELIERRRADGTLVIAVIGEVDLATAPELRGSLLWSIEVERESATLIDFASCTFIDAVALAVIIEAADVLDKRIQKLHIINLGGQPRQLFELTGVDRAVGIEPDLFAAAGRSWPWRRSWTDQGGSSAPEPSPPSRAEAQPCDPVSDRARDVDLPRSPIQGGRPLGVIGSSSPGSSG